MANILCDQCGANQAVMILTNIENGDVVNVCPACFPAFVLALAEAIVGTPDSPEKVAATERATDQAESLQAAGEATETPEEQETTAETPSEPETGQILGAGDDVDPTPPTRVSGRSRGGSSPAAAVDAGDQPAETTTEVADSPTT